MRIEEIYNQFSATPVVTTDTRKDLKGSIFFCLKGPNFDANEFAEKAVEQGASLVVSDDKKNANIKGVALVEDVLTTLQELAQYHRRQFKFPVIGLTGSNGKTTNKELIHAVLNSSLRTYATKGNLNNHIGVPLTLLSIPLDAEMAIVEMGANHQGEIKMLCGISEPDFGMITNIGKAHLEGFGGEEGVKKGKKELYDYIEKSAGKVFVNGSDPLLMDLSDHLDRTIYNAIDNSGTQGRLVSTSPKLSFEFRGENNEWILVETNLVGSYNFPNLMAAVGIGKYFQIPDEKIAASLAAYIPENNRSQLTVTERNQVVLDAYNANPTSVMAAIENLSQIEHPSKLVLLGHMMELGETSQVEHQKVADRLAQLGLSAILVGAEFEKVTTKFRKFQNVEVLSDYLRKDPVKNSYILVKGSRSVQMEKVLPVL